jgi:hypothetical protein
MEQELSITLACLLLALATLIFVFFFTEDAADSSPLRSRLDQLFERRDTLYENLRDLRFEYRTGKFSAQDFEQMKQALEAEAVSVLAEIEQITGAGPARPPRAAVGKSA